MPHFRLRRYCRFARVALAKLQVSLPCLEANTDEVNPGWFSVRSELLAHPLSVGNNAPPEV